MSRRGWPGGRALAAALTLHLALAALAFHLAGQHQPPTPDERATPVTLVLADRPASRSQFDDQRPEPPAVTGPTAPQPAAEPRPDAAPSEQAAAPRAPSTTPSPPPEAEPAPAVRDEGGKPLPRSAKPALTDTPKKSGAPVERPKRGTPEGAAASNAPMSPGPTSGVAVYDVVVDGSGRIRSITLAHSSGKTSFDASGEAMIRNGMGFEVPPADPSHELRLFTVTIAFAPEER